MKAFVVFFDEFCCWSKKTVEGRQQSAFDFFLIKFESNDWILINQFAEQWAQHPSCDQFNESCTLHTRWLSLGKVA